MKSISNKNGINTGIDKQKSVGLFCGTFNPIHLGHLLIAECARDQFDLKKIIFVTSPNPPHRKLDPDLLDAEIRHELVELAIQDNPNFAASRLELERSGPSYTIDTVKQVIAQGYEVNLIIGGDNLAYIKEWRNWRELLDLCKLLVVPRLRYLSDAKGDSEVLKTLDPVGDFGLPPGSFDVVEFPGIAVSASSIRKRIAQNKTVLYMVPPAVAKHIAQKKLYYLSPSRKE